MKLAFAAFVLGGNMLSGLGFRRASQAKGLTRALVVAPLAALALSLTPVLPVQAAALTVCASGCDQPTIVAAIAAASAADSISVLDALHTEAGITISKDLTIQGQGATSTIVSGGGGGPVFIVNPGVTATLQNMTISNGSASLGGGIYNDGGRVTVSNTTLSGNSAGAGGGIYNYGGVVGTTLTVTNSTLSGNSAGAGGGIYSEYATLTVSNSTLSGNSATYYSGGGIAHNHSGTVTVSNSTLSGNSATSDGGGIANYFGTLTVSNSTLSGNSSAYGGGGGIYNGGTLTVSNSTLSGNSASCPAAASCFGFGGGIYNYSGQVTATVSNSTLSGNSAYVGGEIFNYSGTLTLSFSTLVSGNTAAIIVNYYGGTLNIKSAIVANNPYGSSCNYTFGGTFTASGTNLDTDGTCRGFTQVTPAQLNLGPLALNSPGTTATHALLTGSVAIDAATDCTDFFGAPVATDQRGVARPQGAACDIGAFEAETGPTGRRRPIVFIPGILGTHLKNTNNITTKEIVGRQVLDTLFGKPIPCGGIETVQDANALWVWPNLNRLCFESDDLFLNQLALNEGGTAPDPINSDPDMSGNQPSIEVGDAGDGFGLTKGKNPEQFVIEKFVLEGLSQDDPQTFVYRGFLKFLNDRGYNESSNTLRVFPYDWRLHFNDLRIIGRLSDTIDDLLRRSGQDRVDIVAHSNGGMVAKAYFAHYGRAAEAKVGRFIMVGTPHYGTTKALKTLLFGENDFLGRLSPILDPNRLGIVARNSPQAYQTMPAERYVRDFIFPVVLETGCEVGGLQGGLVYSDLLRFLQFSIRDVTKLGLQLGLGPSAPFFNSDGTLRDMPLLNPNLDEWVAPHNGTEGWDAWEPQDRGLRPYLFVGYNEKTLEQIVFDPLRFAGCGAIAVERLRGDGTVPAFSAEANGSLIGAKRYYVNTNGEHLQMIKDNRHVWDQIANILDDQADPPVPGIALSPSLASNSYFQVFVGSPVALHIYTADGAHLGPNDLGGIDRQISRASYDVLGETKVASVEQGADYAVKIIAAKPGIVTLSIGEFRDDISVGNIKYPSLPIAEGTTLSFQLRNLQDADALALDIDGDGIPDFQLSSHAAVDPVTYVSLVIDVVKRVQLPGGIQQSLIAKLDSARESLRRGNRVSATGQVNAYLNEVVALSGKQIPTETVGALTAFGTILRSLIP